MGVGAVLRSRGGARQGPRPRPARPVAAPPAPRRPPRPRAAEPLSWSAGCRARSPQAGRTKRRRRGRPRPGTRGASDPPGLCLGRGRNGRGRGAPRAQNAARGGADCGAQRRRTARSPARGPGGLARVNRGPARRPASTPRPHVGGSGGPRGARGGRGGGDGETRAAREKPRPGRRARRGRAGCPAAAALWPERCAERPAQRAPWSSGGSAAAGSSTARSCRPTTGSCGPRPWSSTWRRRCGTGCSCASCCTTSPPAPST